MVQKLDRLQETPSQTAGPYVHIGLMPTFTGNGGCYDNEIGVSPIRDGARGTAIEITGTVADGTGWVLRDAVLESWQADAQGKYPGQAGADPNVTGHCRFAADPATGEFKLRTIKPGPVAMRGGLVQAPHIALWIVARGINIGLSTRIYFDDEDNGADPLLARIEQRHRVQTLMARNTGAGTYRFDIKLQGEGETVFLDM
jgi:protocatechuate 3,4-dioxygenase alpha subunit